jgi:seryl-tRNA synthetase
MTANQSSQIVKSPNTKKAIAVLTKFAKMEAEYKALEKEAKAASDLIKEAMIKQDIQKLEIDMPNLQGYITLAERTSYKADDLDKVDDDLKKLVLDSDKIKALTVLTGMIPTGIQETKTKYITKKLKVVE